jgi:hypothetical protein
MPKPFDGLDLSKFWNISEYSERNHTDISPTDEMISSTEQALGFKIPQSYIELSKYQNGGIPNNCFHRTAEPTSWSSTHVAISSISAIGKGKLYSLCGKLGSDFMIQEWGYPPIGIYFGDCPSAGHDMICLDYRNCGSKGEPTVVHVDQEFDYKVTFVAGTFEAFIRGLQPESDFPDED